jgi:hypothetical protein
MVLLVHKVAEGTRVYSVQSVEQVLMGNEELLVYQDLRVCLEVLA